MLGFSGLSKHNKLHLSLSTHNPLCFGFISWIAALVYFLKPHYRKLLMSLVNWGLSTPISATGGCSLGSLAVVGLGQIKDVLGIKTSRENTQTSAAP